MCKCLDNRNLPNLQTSYFISMEHSADFLQAILDSVTEHIVIIDEKGEIQFVNNSWVKFGANNDCTITSDWRGINYLKVCNESSAKGETHASKAAEGTKQVIEGKSGVFYHEYPCHSPTEKRWFMMRVTPLRWEKKSCFIISHQNITERKLAEEKITALSRIDGLTGLANRRYFDEFLAKEWRRGARLNTPVSLIMLDIDFFKRFNDSYGHQAGDECLKQIGAVLRKFAKRPGDIAARYGGEEFVLVLGNTNLMTSTNIARQILENIWKLEILHENSDVSSFVTASLGVATFFPRRDISEQILIKAADEALYDAKNKGRNRIEVSKTQIV